MKIKCVDCVYFRYGFYGSAVYGECNHSEKYMPLVFDESEECECEFFIEESGISLNEALTEQEKEKIIASAKNDYLSSEKLKENFSTWENYKIFVVDTFFEQDKNVMKEFRQ